MTDASSHVQEAIVESVRYGVHRWMYTDDLTAPEVEAIQLAIESECGSHTDTRGDVLVYTGEKNGKPWTIFLK